MELKKIESFQVDHNKLLRGIYVSRKDVVGDSTVTTFDVRMKEPNREDVLSTGTSHTIEHLCATYLRSKDEISNETIYFGPMGCRTGFYVILKGDLISEDVTPLITQMFKFVSEFNEEIPGAVARDCGNCTDMDLTGSSEESKKFYDEVLTKLEKKNLVYPA